MVEGLLDAIDRLADMPRLGHRRPMPMSEDIRQWVWSRYVIVYRADTRPIHVLRVLDGHRDIEGLLR